MELFYRFANALRSLFCRNRLEDEMAEEMAYHLKMTIEQNEANGMSPGEARKAAMRQFGGVEQLKEECRDAWGIRFVMEIWRNVRFGLRVLTRSKYFTIAALLTLGLCIGVNTVIFSILNSVILRPLPFAESENLVELYNTHPKYGVGRAPSNPTIYLDYKENVDAFSDLALVRNFSGNMSGGDSPKRIDGLLVTPDYFRTLGVKPELGSFFNEGHGIPGKDNAIILSYRFWKSTFAGDQTVVGQKTIIDGNTFTILGIAPRKLDVMNPEAKLYRAWALDQENVGPQFRYSRLFARLIGRLKTSDLLAQAKAQIDTLDQRFYDDPPPDFENFYENSGHETLMVPLQETRIDVDVASKLYMLQVAALFILLIGCVNISNLLLAQSNARTSEFAIRCALGAAPVTIGFQLIVESLLLAVGGCFIGAFFGWGGIELINRLAMDMLPPTLPLELDETTLLFTVGLALVTGLIVGILPIIKVFRKNLMAEVHQSSRSSSASQSSRLVSSFLECGQTALALVLLVGASLLIFSFSKALSKLRPKM